MLILNFLNKIVEVFQDYFDSLEQESIRDNFVLIYELLDEMCDFGYPQHTDSKILKDYICIQEKHKLDVANEMPQVVTGPTAWRKPDVFYKKNEVFLDVIEKIKFIGCK